MHADISNLFLAGLSSESRQLLLGHTTSMPLPVGTQLYAAEQVPLYGYFMTSGIASVVTTMADGGSAEVGLIGREGVVGCFHLLGPAVVSTQCFIQLEATALRIPLTELRKAFQSS